MLHQNETRIVRDIAISNIYCRDEVKFKAAFKEDLKAMFGSNYYKMWEADVKFHMHFKISVQVPEQMSYQPIADMVANTLREFTERFADVGTPDYNVWTNSLGAVWVVINISCVRELNNG